MEQRFIDGHEIYYLFVSSPYSREDFGWTVCDVEIKLLICRFVCDSVGLLHAYNFDVWIPNSSLSLFHSLSLSPFSFCHFIHLFHGKSNKSKCKMHLNSISLSLSVSPLFRSSLKHYWYSFAASNEKLCLPSFAINFVDGTAKKFIKRNSFEVFGSPPSFVNV